MPPHLKSSYPETTSKFQCKTFVGCIGSVTAKHASILRAATRVQPAKDRWQWVFRDNGIAMICLDLEGDTEAGFEAPYEAKEPWLTSGTEPLITEIRLGIAEYSVLMNRESEEITLSRDFAGTRPVYIWRSSKRIYFSSSEVALLSISNEQINRDHIYDCIVQRFRSMSSLKHGIRLLEPGTSRVFNFSQEFAKDAEPQQTTGPGVNGGASNEDLVSELYSCLCGAIDRQTMDEDTIQIYLSDGIDSNLIAAIAIKELGKSVIGYSIDNRSNPMSGWNFESSFAKKLQREVINYNSDEDDWNLAKKAALASGGILPFLQGGAKLALGRAVQIRNQPVLTGDGADEFFGGYPYMYSCGSDSTLKKDPQLGWISQASTVRIDPRDEFIQAMRCRWNHLLQPEFRKSLSDWNETRLIASSGESRIRSQLGWDRETILANYFLRYLGYDLDTIAGVTTAQPYLDTAVTRIALMAAPEQHIRGGCGKQLLRRMAKRYKLLEERTLSRPKMGFVHPPLGRSWPDYDVVKEYLNSEALGDTRVFDPAAILNLLSRVSAGEDSVIDRMILVSTWTTQVLLRRFQ